MSRLARLSQRSTALFVCDIQSVFKPLIHEMPSVIAGASVLMRAAAALQVPMLVTEQYPKAFGHTVDELADLARTHSVPVLEKSRFSMLSPATLDAVKPEQGLQSVVLCGIEAHVCVQQTALDLLEKGISVHLPVDAVSSQRPTDREAALFVSSDSGTGCDFSVPLHFTLHFCAATGTGWRNNHIH